MVDNSLDLFGAILGGEAKTDMKTGNIMSKMCITEINFLFIGFEIYTCNQAVGLNISNIILLPFHQYIPPLKGVSPYFNTLFFIFCNKLSLPAGHKLHMQ